MCYYFYEVTFCSEMMEEPATESGFVHAFNYADAAKQIAEDYDEYSIESFSLKNTQIDTNCIEVKEINECVQDGLKDNLKLSNKHDAD